MESENKTNGAFVGLVVIVIILIIGGVYVWQSKVKTAMEEKNTNSGNITNQDSNDLNSLDSDVQSTDTNVNADVNNVQ